MFHGLALGPLVSTDVRSVKDFLAWAKANPSQVNYGLQGAGGEPGSHFPTIPDLNAAAGTPPFPPELSPVSCAAISTMPPQTRQR